MSLVTPSLELQSDLATIVGDVHVLASPNTRNFSIDDVVPATVVSPGSPEEVAAVLRFASEQRLSILPAGGMTKQSAGYTPGKIDILLRTNRLNSLQHYDPGDLTVGFGAGISIDESQRILADHNQFLPLDVAHPDRATIGGVLATNSHGPMKTGYGGIRDFCLGIQFVTSDGKIAKGGGKVVKNVAGYDLMKLLIGSYGTLAVITSANFKVFPRPRQLRTFIAEFATIRETMVFRDSVMRLPLVFLAMEVISPHAHEYLQTAGDARDPDHYRPAAPVKPHDHWGLMLRAAGSDNVLARYARDLGNSVQPLAGVEEATLWAAIAAFEALVAKRYRNTMLMSVNTTINSVAGMLDAAERAATEQNMLFAAVGRASLGNFIVTFTPLSVDPPSAMQYANVASALRASLLEDGSAVVLRCPKEAKPHFEMWGTTRTDLTSMRAVRAALDPPQTLNRGRFLI